MKNVAHKLNCITESGYYQYNLNARKVRNGEEVELVYLHSQEVSLHDSHEVTSRQPVVTPATPGTHWQRWRRDDIDDFVIKLGFLDSEVADREKIYSFLHQNEVRVVLCVKSMYINDLFLTNSRWCKSSFIAF